MNLFDRIRPLIGRQPSFYGRLWITSINLIGVAVVGAVLFDVSLLLGTGQTGVFQRALYPLGPPALTLGLGVAELNRRHIAISGGVLCGYLALLALVRTLGNAIATEPRYIVGGVGVVIVLATIGWALGRLQRHVNAAVE